MEILHSSSNSVGSSPAPTDPCSAGRQHAHVTGCLQACWKPQCGMEDGPAWASRYAFMLRRLPIGSIGTSLTRFWCSSS